MKRLICLTIIALTALLAGCATNGDPWTDTLYLTSLDVAGGITANSVNATDITADNLTTGQLYINGSRIFPSSHAEMYFMGTEDIILAAPNTYYLVDGTATVYEAEQFEAGTTTPRLTYIGTTTKHFQAMASVSVSSNVVNTLTTWYFYINGNPHPSAAATQFIALPGDVGTIGLINLDQLSENDYVEVWVAANKACTLTVQNFVVDIVSVN